MDEIDNLYEAVHEIHQRVDGLEADLFVPSDRCKQWLLDDAREIERDKIIEGSIHHLHKKGWLEYDSEANTYHPHTVYSEMLRSAYSSNRFLVPVSIF